MVVVIKKIVQFGSVGILGSLTNLSIFTALTFLNTHHNLASVVAFLVALTQNYTLNNNWTFKDHTPQTKQKFFKYFVLNILSFSINLLVLNLIVLNFGQDNMTKIIGQILGIGAAMGLNFMGSYLVVFAKPKKAIYE